MRIRAESGWLLLAPGMALVTVVSGTALIAVILTSLGLMPLVGEPRLSFEGYTGATAELRASAAESLRIATVSTGVATLVGLLLAGALVAHTRGAALLGLAAAAVVTVPHLVGAASVGLLLSDLGVAQRWSGVPTGSWPELVAGPVPWATVGELAWKESAFVALVVVATVGRRYRELREVAAVLGAGPVRRGRAVFLPLAAPAAASAALIVFVYSMGIYEVSRLLGRTFPETLPVLSYRLFTSIDLSARPQAAAAAMVLTGLSVVVALLALPLLRRLSAGR